MILHGDCLEEMRKMEDNSVDSIVTDPPYELGFMGKSWDSTGIANNVEMWKEALRVLKYGGHLLAFSGTRTYHRMAVAIEDAGFEIRDMIEWVYGSGFPKSHNIGKAVDKMQGNEREVVAIKDSLALPINDQLEGWGEKKEYKVTKGTSEWEGWGTALKPAHEPICMARKPLAEKTVAENVLKYGTGGINIDESRVEYQGESDLKQVQDKLRSFEGAKHKGISAMIEKQIEDGYRKEWTTDKQFKAETNTTGRFPANLIHDNSEEVRECFPDTKSGGKKVSDKANKDGLFGYGGQVQNDLEASSGNASRFFKSIPQGRFPANLIHDNSEEVRECFPETNASKSANRGLQHSSRHGGLADIGGNIKDGTDTIRGHDDNGGNASRFFKSIPQGRFPANLIHDNSEEVRECFPETKSGSGVKKKASGTADSIFNINKIEGEYLNGDSGNASRFFKSIIYQAKASKKERNAGCEGLEEKAKTEEYAGRDTRCSVCGKFFLSTTNPCECSEEEFGAKSTRISNPTNKNNHPTVKPIALMEYLIKMVTPKGGTVLDPFMGSGTTGIACKKEGFEFIGVELDEDYFKIAKARIEKLEHQHELF